MMILSLGVHSGFAQGRYELTKKEFHSFKLARTYHYSGVQLFLKGKYGKAEKYFKKSLNAFPKFSYSDHFLAKICYNKKDLCYSYKICKKIENFVYSSGLTQMKANEAKPSIVCVTGSALSAHTFAVNSIFPR